MKQSRASFKFKLRQCKREEARVRADILANDIVKRNSTQLWKHVSKQNRRCMIPADTVGGATGRDSIACMWQNHFANLFNYVDSASDKESVLYNISRVSNVHDTSCSDDVKSSVNYLSANKACGLDNIYAEHILYASPIVHHLLSICFNVVIVHGFLPSDLTDTVLVPIVREKTGDISDKGNCRHIAIASVISKVFEMSLLAKLESMYSSDYQFGFKPKHSTDLCIYTLKEVIEFYKSQSSSVYVCFMDASKAFDRVNHWTLFKKTLLIETCLTFLSGVQFIGTERNMLVSDGAQLAQKCFTVSNGVRHGGILSPLFFNVYLDGLSDILCKTECGCTMGGRMINHLMYADDVVIVSPLAKGLQRLIHICAAYGDSHDITFNHAKTVCMYLPSKVNCKLNSPLIYLNSQLLSLVPKFKYLGSLLTQDNSDDENMRRQRGNCYARSNGLIKNLYACSTVVKCDLFKAFCCNMYCSHLWCDYKNDTLRRLIVGYNHYFRIIMNLLGIVARAVCLYIMEFLASMNYGGKVFMVLDIVSTIL